MTQTLKKHWDLVGAGYDKYWQSQGKQMLLRKELDFISRFLALSHTENALDIGIGSGRILENYFRQPFPKHIDGIDIAQTMVHGRRLSEKIHAKQTSSYIGCL